MAETVPDSVADPEIRAERAFLAHARAALARMHEDVVTTQSVQDSAEDADYTLINRILDMDRQRRAAALVDLPDVPLFFGRLEYPPGAVYEDDPSAGSGAGDGTGPAAHIRTPDADRVYIGRRHVHDGLGDPLVIDWRAPISAAFYRAGPADPQGVLRRRRYGFSDTAELTAYEDEPLAAAHPGPPAAAPAGEDTLADRLLHAEIERPRTGPMRDIVATIQPEQDDLVRAPLRPTLCVQGAPGTGKTAVGLHRIAYLLYTERDRLRRDGGVAIIGPNRSFLSYIRRVLPALGEVGVRQTTIDELAARVPVRRTEDPEAERVKGDARMAEVIRRDLWSLPTPPEDTLVVERGSRRWRLPADELAEVLAELRTRDMAYGAGPNLLLHRIAHLLMRRIENSGESVDSGTLSALRRNRTVSAAVRAMWPKADPVRLVLGLLTDPDRLARAAEGILTPEEQRSVLLPGRPRGPKSARWSLADLALIDEAAGLIERPDTLGHIVVDEAQDLSPMQCRVVARRCARGSLTVLGDIAQATSPSAVDRWETLLAHLGQPDARLAVLDRGFRVPAQIIDFAARLLPEIAPGLGRPTGVRQGAGALRVTAARPDEKAGALVAACRDALAGEGSVGVITAEADAPALAERLRAEGLPTALVGETEDALEAARLVCVPATLAKGLEFDAVVVDEPARIAAAEARGLNRLYVVLTRAVTRLHIVHSRPLPAALAAYAGETAASAG
ncbi:AAA family ATPase [Streptomonospora sp. S1-112]|uniref:AAA family ATPase n=1 Tax=Streptomonospora mangrovi TaxID=2883123 RepID=A0A9X3NV53_9ACTN|nr:AAA family ATPase [Streptomonospora mangrovi]MDA0567455.1 AAA family ATPase [Streptomonospora mangrovi]